MKESGTSADVSIRQHSSERGLDTEYTGVLVEAQKRHERVRYVGRRQHTSAYVSIRQTGV
jgi:hypothetical protein